jgi:pyruvate,water dikinase
VSREYGLPGVVGCVGATTAFKTGMRVRVDGDTGEVWAV